MMKNKLILMFLFLGICIGMLSGCTPEDNDNRHDNNIIYDEEQSGEIDTNINTIMKENEIETYLNMIYKSKINQTIYQSYSNITKSYSLLYFYSGDDIEVIQSLVNPSYTSTRPSTLKKSIDWIVIHDTGNNAKTATAKAHVSYLNTNPGTSWHYTVDSTSIYQHIPDNEVAYHAGDGTRPTGTTWYSNIYSKWNNGGGNANGIGIEMAVNSGSDFNLTLMNTASLVANLLIKYDMELSQVKKHYDFSGKTCPLVLISSNNWDNFLELVEIAYYYKKYLSDISFEFVPITNTISSKGIISLNNYKGNNIEYKVIVSDKSIIKEYYYSSILD